MPPPHNVGVLTPYNAASPDIAATLRFEPVVAENDVTPSVCANVHDALWMLTQQWRVFEFNGEDAGSVVQAKVETESIYLTRYKGGTNPVEAFDANVPLEAKVESIPLIIDLGLSLELGVQWHKILEANSIGYTHASFLTNYEISVPTGTTNPVLQSNRNAMQARITARSRIINGGQLYKDILNNVSIVTNSGILPSNTTDLAHLTAAQNEFLAWVNATYFLPGISTDKTWEDQKLEYKFSVSAPMGAAGGAQFVLDADKYKAGTVDWYSVDLNPDPAIKLAEGSSTTIPIINNKVSVKSYLTHKIRWKGMPKGRWWEFEDSNVDLAKMLTQKQDITKLILMEFGLIYSNDWFVIPHRVDNGTITSVNGLVVTDAFGQQFIIDRAGTAQNYGWQNWDMFQVNKKGQPAHQNSLNKLLMMPALINKVESDPVEKVLFLRDDMANMIWGVEETVPDEMFGGLSGKQAAGDLQDFLEAHTTVSPQLGYDTTDAKFRYRLQTSVPENWIPFVATTLSTNVGYRGRQVQRGRLLRYINGQDLANPIEPRTSILRRHLDDRNAQNVPTPGPYFINQEEVSKSGFEVSTTFQRARWYDGKVYLWLGRKKQTGRGESGLRFAFDILEDKEPGT